MNKKFSAVRFALCIPFLALTAFSLPLSAAENGWKLKKDEDGVQVYSRPVEGWSIHQTRASAKVAASLDSVVAVINDVPNLPALVDVISKAQLESQTSPVRYRYHMIVDMPWPVSDRELMSDRVISQDSTTGVVTITDNANAAFQARGKGRVAILKSTQVWTLTPLGDNQVAVESVALADPNGPIPAALINSMSVGMPFQSMSNLRKLVKIPFYAEADLDFISDQLESGAGAE